MHLSIAVIIVLALLGFRPSLATPLLGVVQLDSLSFNKTVRRFPFSLVKFDGGYPTGEKHKIFAQLGRELSEVRNLLVAEVRIKTYGDKENEDIAMRFGFQEADYPEIILFIQDKKGGTLREIRYGAEVSADAVINFLKSKAGSDLTLPGCLKEFDRYAQFFVNNDEKDRQRMLDKVVEIVSEMRPGSRKDKATRYMKIMETFVTRGLEGVEHEEERARKLLEEKLSQEKRINFEIMLNVLKSFKYTKKPSRRLERKIRDEL
ncbi:hypothetical protein TCAL_11026 [Tigriopus californicus]|uniref:Endoplasmic reticulum resident protein 29 C-terminal domain-containing protein n=1 Tax=Tigriopus californicus TaxID=6832 RepID=A0A553NEX6_TIGCA|nr:endoplasmic reticulum resident protein 29-like [Tigriopus californicus]TRY63958.1 hypothetical protein TCAL_11026 [Tigriopus californicus]|eukprot:TCALIF_11026-PA protein Name:"Similar to wbl Protein windbeutel (Drosophila melanogaster)" AED:0.02 eAED:0.02 QI:0/-1/0/1/-1/1/1/0/261